MEPWSDTIITTPSHRAVFLVISALQGKGGAKIAQGDLSLLTGYGIVAVNNAINKLAKLGAITTRRTRPATYTSIAPINPTPALTALLEAPIDGEEHLHAHERFILLTLAQHDRSTITPLLRTNIPPATIFRALLRFIHMGIISPPDSIYHDPYGTFWLQLTFTQSRTWDQYKIELEATREAEREYWREQEFEHWRAFMLGHPVEHWEPSAEERAGGAGVLNAKAPHLGWLERELDDE